ncbi:CubicO group peptidase (beta-lactamase class C family) [Kribbella voronezhensis]|uniref:CubicO group peptidase (Beta-lactamase class C family) n=1 Tax=Kribbella voronezhensis TaxID=2512212 RepID=A0A4V6Q5Q4_9ACTN|nr:serine hydrolase domain-containing protein [Kribbella voronezhensis]TDU82223.1 CubicO group peptidase (beta-lactamase class C family) [Kribbella voronezhensis]
MSLTRRTLLRSAAVAVPAAALPTLPATARSTGTTTNAREAAKIDRLVEKIEAGMAKYAIPGAGLGLWYRGREYVRGFGVTNVDQPSPVTADTVFRIGSTTKTFTATAIMRLVEQGRIRLDRPVRAYLPDFRTADPSVAARITVRHLLNHSAGWQGDYFEDFGDGDDALARYVGGVAELPQLTPLGKVFAYNNAAIGVAGRIIEVVTGKPYETATRELVVDPLGLRHSRFFPSELGGFSVAASHNIVNGKAVVEPSFYPMPRSLHSVGGLISSARDQLRYARFHLGHPGIPHLLSNRARIAMRSNPGPGGTLFVELDGVGVTWMLRPTLEGPTVVQHGGDWSGQHSGFLMVPERDFAITLLTNSESGPALVAELFGDDWALREFAGLSNLPAVPRALPPRRLAAYEGSYVANQIGIDGKPGSFGLDLTADKGALVASLDGQAALRLPFYRKDYVLALTPDGEPTHSRANFVRGSNGDVEWLRYGGRLFRRQPADAPKPTLRPAHRHLL